MKKHFSWALERGRGVTLYQHSASYDPLIFFVKSLPSSNRTTPTLLPLLFLLLSQFIETGRTGADGLAPECGALKRGPELARLTRPTSDHLTHTHYASTNFSLSNSAPLPPHTTSHSPSCKWTLLNLLFPFSPLHHSSLKSLIRIEFCSRRFLESLFLPVKVLQMINELFVQIWRAPPVLAAAKAATN